MKNSSKKIDRAILKSLEPLNRLNPILLDELAQKSIIEDLPAGRTICRHGEKDSRQIYLMSGQLEMVTPGQSKVKLIKSKSPLTTAVAEGSPRNVTLKTKTASTLLYIDADLLELLMSDEPDSSNSATAYEVTELTAEDNDDWMLTFLQSPAFLKLPTANIQKLLVKMDEISVKKDQVVITQGAKDDNYFIIKSGSCNVHRKPYENAANVLLAVLPTGSGFGEESLIANSTRNATITMREDGTLMRLKKNDFLELLINPLINYFEHSETQQKINQGCVVIDVRSQEQAKKQPLEGAVNIPLSMLRVKFDNFNADREYLLVCEDSTQSAAAAFLMIQQGFKCSVLRNGINGSQVQVENNIASPATSAPAAKSTPSPVAEKAQQQLAEAKKQSEKIAQQQKLIKEASLKAEQDILRHKKELAESRARLENKASQAKAAELKLKAEQELVKAQQEARENERKQKEVNEARLKAEEMLKKSAEAAELSRKNAEAEAAAIKQRALEEVENLRAEMEAAKLKMEQESARIKQEEELIKQSALQIKQQADEIRREAMLDAQQVREEVEATRTLLSEKLRAVEEEEKLKQEAIIAEAKKRADELAASKTAQAAKEAEAIRQKAKEDAARLHAELETTRKQIEAEAARAIEALKEQSNQVAKQESTTSIEKTIASPAPQVIEKPKQEEVDYSAVSIPGLPAEEKIDYEAAKRKAEAIKAKLARAKVENDSSLQDSVFGLSEQSLSQVKIHKANDKVILEGEEDIFIFKEPDEKIAKANTSNTTEAKTIPIQHNIGGDKSFTSIPQSESINIVIQQQPTLDKNNPFLRDEPVAVSTTNHSSRQSQRSEPDFVLSKKPQQFNKQAYKKRHNASKSNTLAIAASILMIIAGAVFTLHATDTVKIQAIAALFNSGNDTVQPVTELAKTKKIHTKVLRADTNVHATQKVESKMDDIMQGWKKVLSESKTPKKLENKK